MRFRQGTHNPLREIIQLIPPEGIALNRVLLSLIGAFLAEGGVVCETYEEVISCLELLACKEYNILSMETTGRDITIYRTYNGN